MLVEEAWGSRRSSSSQKRSVGWRSGGIDHSSSWNSLCTQGHCHAGTGWDLSHSAKGNCNAIEKDIPDNYGRSDCCYLNRWILDG